MSRIRIPVTRRLMLVCVLLLLVGLGGFAYWRRQRSRVPVDLEDFPGRLDDSRDATFLDDSEDNSAAAKRAAQLKFRPRAFTKAPRVLPRQSDSLTDRLRARRGVSLVETSAKPKAAEAAHDDDETTETTQAPTQAPTKAPTQAASQSSEHDEESTEQPTEAATAAPTTAPETAAPTTAIATVEPEHQAEKEHSGEEEFAPTRAPNVDLVPNPAGDLPKFSDEAPFTIVIVDYNEPLLAKTVDEILKVRSEKLVHEILILDDFSDRPVTYDMFTRDPRISIYRAKERLGLIRARIDGSNLAAGTFMVLIDAHCKPHEDWLYPIDKSLRENYKRILNMQVGLLDGDKWKEMPGGAIGSKAAFYWSLTHFWENPMSIPEIKTRTNGHDKHPDQDESPITMGMFATTKRWWRTIGGMDTDLSTWGGENIEISLRTWLCGGEIRVARGSRIDHAFRTKFPYNVDGGLYRRNLVRIAEAWLGPKYKERFYKAAGMRPGSVEFGSIQEQLDTQKRLQCKPFDWYYWKFFNRSPIPQPK